MQINSCKICIGKLCKTHSENYSDCLRVVLKFDKCVNTLLDEDREPYLINYYHSKFDPKAESKEYDANL